MRKSVAALALTIVAALGMYVPTAAAATSDAKVVIIVGPVGSQTSSFRDTGNQAYAEAIKHTSNVTKVYSPNATWSKVKAAIQGANIVVYLGHGNGYPSPYSTSPRPLTQNGFGLNDSSRSDNKHVYRGEQYIGDEVSLAPNAVVLLSRLCYASGAGEPHHADPSLKVARQRVDNFGAGFIRAGARAVIADGHRPIANYIRTLFTTNQTIDQLWRSTNQYGNITTFESSRSNGYTGYLDPKKPGVDYYRSMVAKPSLTTREVTGVIGDTGVDPATFAVPGRASVRADETEILSSGLLTTGLLPADTRLEVVARPIQTTGEGESLLQVRGLDDPSIEGYVREIDLQPRDSTAPVILTTDTSAASFSPSGSPNSATLTARFSESVSWKVRFRDGSGTVLATMTGSGSEASATWDGLVSGSPVPDGTYDYVVEGDDAWLNGTAKRAGTVRVDTTPPTLSGITAGADPLPWFSPNGDGHRDTYTVSGTMSEKGDVVFRARANGTVVRKFTVDVSSGVIAVTWNGRGDEGAPVADGEYELELTPRDAVGNVGTARRTSVVVNNLVGFVRAGPTLFYPQDKDKLATTTTLAFRLDRAATVTWTLRSSSGAIVDTYRAGVALGPGDYSRTFNGRRQDGTMLPRGVYTSHVTATDGSLTAAQSVKVEMNAFSMKVSDTTPRRGQKIKVTVVSAEALAKSPRLIIKQPGKSQWSVALKKVAKRTYVATFTIKTGGSKGTLTLRAKGPDKNGQVNKTTLKLPLG